MLKNYVYGADGFNISIQTDQGTVSFFTKLILLLVSRFSFQYIMIKIYCFTILTLYSVASTVMLMPSYKAVLIMMSLDCPNQTFLS